MADLLHRLSQPDDRVLLGLLVMVVGYALWGAVLARRRGKRPKNDPST